MNLQSKMDASMMCRTFGRAVYGYTSKFALPNPSCVGSRGHCLMVRVRTTQNGQPLGLGHTACRQLSSLAEQFQLASDARRQSFNVQTPFRTDIDDPTVHSMQQEGLFYTVPEEDVKRQFQKGLSLQFARQAKTFNETCFMVRQPALEVIDCLKHLNLDHTAPRFLLYGANGSGKTMTMAHVIHYCARNNWLIVHAPWPSDWNCRYHETSPSPHKAGRMDLPMEAAEWLVNFRSQNSHFLKDIKLSKKYVWTKREATEAGSPLSDIVEFGLNRMKFASDCVGAILKEVRLQAADNKIKVLVAVDGVNAFWNQTTIRNTERELLMADQISLVYNFKKFLLSTWTHGAILCSVDTFANARKDRESHTPHYLLGEEVTLVVDADIKNQSVKHDNGVTQGYAWLDPFVPVHVPTYSEKEAYSCIEYYLDRNWLQHKQAQTEEGKKELIFLSNKNPFQLMKICASK